jgi:hypothetical protein
MLFSCKYTLFRHKKQINQTPFFSVPTQKRATQKAWLSMDGCDTGSTGAHTVEAGLQLFVVDGQLDLLIE